MSGALTVAVAQFAPGDDAEAPVVVAERLVRDAAASGAGLVVLPELFSGAYFCKRQDERHFSAAAPWQTHPVVERFAPIAAELGIVLPLSIFEREGPHYYNSVVMVDADGAALGVYRKSHIPDGPGYQEKFYFRPGQTGFKVWQTKVGAVGVGICWDQWFPEAARAMVLQGADILVYPTAIGDEPQDPSLDTEARWRRAMVGHAVCNAIPVAAANRVGEEDGQSFYGSSFVAGTDGSILAALDRKEAGFAAVTIDLEAAAQERASWGFFRDRRPGLYRGLTEE
ncbi:MAG: N-carbamoylputrescine amidase [Pseudomonadota bacterium]